MKKFAVKITLKRFIYTYHTKINRIFSWGFKNPGYIALYSWKGILIFILIYLFLFFNCWSWQNFELTCTRIIFEFKKSNFLNLNKYFNFNSPPRTHRALLIAVSAFWCRSLLLSSYPATCIKNLTFNIMRCTTIFNDVLSHLEIVLLMLQKSSGNNSDDLANIDGTASVICNIKYNMGFQILVKR